MATPVDAKVLAWRRDIHQHPELGNRETRTAKLVADHLRKLAIAGLVLKRNDGPSVRHKVSDRGHTILMFCKTLQ